MGRMGRDTEQDRIDQANTNQKSACGKPESGKQEAPRLWGKRTANSSEIVHTVCLLYNKIGSSAFISIYLFYND